MGKKNAAEVCQSLFDTSDLMHYLHMKTEPVLKNNISISQLKLLGCLFRHKEEGMRLKDIAFEMDITPGTKFDELPDEFFCPLCHVGKGVRLSFRFNISSILHNKITKQKYKYF